MTTTRTRKYIRSEPPALLAEPLTVTLRAHALQAFNDYRQKRHAWLASEAQSEESGRLYFVMQEAAVELAGYVGSAVQHELGEPSDYADE
ncbi:hypothetical protein [Pseudomonas protegens]|uniref:hypothetical protein n=1 Tax=Pseudomonas protegens TaxID=380021 RepID=UPI001B33E82E|nr:hypothetical protein [Pseudomonas protegens]